MRSTYLCAEAWFTQVKRLLQQHPQATASLPLTCDASGQPAIAWAVRHDHVRQAFMTHTIQKSEVSLYYEMSRLISKIISAAHKALDLAM